MIRPVADLRRGHERIGRAGGPSACLLQEPVAELCADHGKWQIVLFDAYHGREAEKLLRPDSRSCNRGQILAEGTLGENLRDRHDERDLERAVFSN